MSERRKLSIDESPWYSLGHRDFVEGFPSEKKNKKQKSLQFLFLISLRKDTGVRENLTFKIFLMLPFDLTS